MSYDGMRDCLCTVDSGFIFGLSEVHLYADEHPNNKAGS